MTFAIPSSWTFEDSEVATDFDVHVREQLPWYDLATNAVAHVARHYIPTGGMVYDIGASTGNIGRALASTLEARSATLVGIEPAKEMAALYQAPGAVHVQSVVGYPFEECDLVVAFLSLMFVPPKNRSTVVSRVMESLRTGGAFVVFDKRESLAGYVGTILARLTLAGKVAAGVSSERIIQKELSLSGVQRPIDPSLFPSGSVEFFRFGEFSGWILEKR